MALETGRPPTISRMLKRALIADLALQELGPEGDHWLTEPLKDARDWSFHLGRQLGFRSPLTEEVHHTLLFLVIGLDKAIQPWPPDIDSTSAQLAHEATKHLNLLELAAMLEGGPAPWRQHRVDGCRISGLTGQLQRIVEKTLAAELRKALECWIACGLPSLPNARASAIKRAEGEQGRPGSPHQSQGRRPFTRPTGKERVGRYAAPYVPPGRT